MFPFLKKLFFAANMASRDELNKYLISDQRICAAFSPALCLSVTVSSCALILVSTVSNADGANSPSVQSTYGKQSFLSDLMN